VLEATLENMDQGIMMIDANLRVQVHNRRALELLDLPPELLAARPHFYDVTRYQFATGDFENADEAFRNWVQAGGIAIVHQSYERERPNGTVLEIRTVPLASGGAVRTFTDVTARKHAERRVEHMARHDALTALANRVLFRERLETALARCAERAPMPPCSASTSTNSRPSTIRWAIRWGTRSSRKWRPVSSRRCGRVTWWRASEATSSPSC
jgi:transcriptional regulator with PAS, ATPase and Fis domain